MTDPFTSRGRRDAAQEERLEVLRLLQDGTITADEAARLLDALEPIGRQPAAPAAGRHVRVRVSDSATGKSKVNLTLPLGLIDAGFGVARRFVPDRIGDVAAVREAITSGFRGPILDVDDDGERVEIIVE